MCGRYTLKTGRKKLAEQFQLDELPDFPPRFNLGPTQDGLVVRPGDKPDTRTAAWLRWGLIPGWMKEGARAPLLINARSETVASKPAYRDALKRRRCLVLADGFFEWARHGAIKQPYYLTLNRGEPFAMAGLWERWRPPDGAAEDVVETFAIITTQANEVLAPIHDRMPVILEPEFHDDWINPLVTDADVLQPLLKPYPGAHMVMRAVNARVNNIRNDDPECLNPPEPEGSRAPASAQQAAAGDQLGFGFGE